MTLESLKEDHLNTQRKISRTARARHFESKGRFENEMTLVQTIESLEDRITKLEHILNEVSNESQCDRSSDDTRSDDTHAVGIDETLNDRKLPSGDDINHINVRNNDFIR